MKCSNCGSNIPGSAKFCGVCGAATQPAESETALKTVAFDPSSDPEFKAAAAKLEAENKKANAESAAENKAAPAKKAEKSAPVKASSKPSIESSDASSSDDAKISEDDDAKISEDDDAETIAKKKGKFRETIWFMQAEDPEMMSSIENEHLEEREATYQDPGGNLDERSREKFSLNISESSMMKAVDRRSLDADDSPENAKSWFYASVIIGTISVGYLIYLAVAK
jgi:hypothetical protein